MAYYTNITLSDANTILSLYDLNKATKLVPIGHGISNSNYIVHLEDGSEIILKISNDKDNQQLLEEQYILLNLKHLGFRYSPIPFRTKNDEPVYQSPPWHGVVFPRIKGQVPAVNHETCFAIGASLATLHLLSGEPKLSSLPYPLRKASEIGYFPEDIITFSNENNCPQDFKNAVQILLPDSAYAFYHSLESELPKSIIHGDLYFDNTLFYAKTLVSMLDFEQAGLGPCIFDIGISISGTCLENKKLSLKLVKSFMKGYLSERSLSLSEKELLIPQILWGFLSISLWRIHRFYLGNLSEERKMSYQELIQMGLDAHLQLKTTSVENILKDS